MSDTVSVDVVGPSYWTYMALVMADCLKTISVNKHVSATHIPKGVYRDARRFFDLVMQSVDDELKETSPASSMNAYAIAAHAVEESSIEPLSELKELDDRLEEYSRLLVKLEQPGSLSEADANTAGCLCLFFRRLADLGNSEIYEKTVDLAPALTSCR